MVTVDVLEDEVLELPDPLEELELVLEALELEELGEPVEVELLVPGLLL